MKRVFITGVSGYLGNKLAAALEEREDIECLVGLDIKEPKVAHKNLVFIKQDIRDSITDILTQYQIDTVIHAAWVVSQGHNTALMEDVNKSGTKNVLDCCIEAGISHLIYTSSTTAYGFHSDNDVPLTEASPLRGNEGFTYGKNKKEIEFLFNAFIEQNPSIKVAILRPCFVVGPGFSNDMSEYLTSKKVVLPTTTAPMQFVHEDDVIRGILHCLDTSVAGTFNLVGEGAMSFDDIAAIQGNQVVRLSERFLRGLISVLYFLRLSPRHVSSLDMTMYSWIASREKFIEQTGFTYQYDSRSAFEDFVKSTQ